MLHRFDIDGESAEAFLTKIGDAWWLLHNGESHEVSLTRDYGHGSTLNVDGVAQTVHIARQGDTVFVHSGGHHFEVAYRDAVGLYGAVGLGRAGDHAHAPMPGSVLAVSVQVGQAVSRGDVMVVIESMKLEMAIKADRDGVVESVHAIAGRTFERDAILVSLHPLAEEV